MARRAPAAASENVIGSGGQAVTVDRDGRPYRHYPVAVSAGAMALAWARQEDAPHGATVHVDYEINALGRLGVPWQAMPAETLAFAVVLRPALDVDDADVPWLLAGVATALGIEASTGVDAGTSWPDLVVDRASGRPIASILVEAQLAPGRVRAAVVTVRIDLGAIGVDPGDPEGLLTSVLSSISEACDRLAEDKASAAALYENRCVLVGERVKLRLRPQGETRGEVAGVGERGHLQLRSSTGMVERITVDMLRQLEVV